MSKETGGAIRWDIKENCHNPVLEHAIVKTVAGFLNAHGGSLLIGVSDNGVVLGLDRDYKHTKKRSPSRDQFELWLTNHLIKKLGSEAKPCFHIDFAEIADEDVCRITVYRAARPVFVEKNGQEVLYIRQGNATNQYKKLAEILEYKEQHWPDDQPAPAPPPPPSALHAAPVKKAVTAKGVFDDFRQTLSLIEKHPNDRYFILKTIIINNLYGVDIMDEAVEICKLRLFLKLIAQVETFEQIEPLPDIDFNIRAGNTLVGFASLEQVKESMEGDFVSLESLPRVEDDAAHVDRAFQRFRVMQTTPGGEVTAKIKRDLRNRLLKLDTELDRYLAGEYGVRAEKDRDFKAWLDTHKPFHWFVEFYGIMHNGGFDVILGNPPYLELRQVDYSPHGFKTGGSGAIHAMCIERSFKLLQPNGAASMIVPLALVSTQRMEPIQQLIEENASTWYANFAWRPGKLFDTVNRALTIFLATKSGNGNGCTYSTAYQKWNSDTRDDLIPTMMYCEIDRDRPAFWAPKLGCSLEVSILNKILGVRSKMSTFVSKVSNYVYYRTTGGLYWKVFTDFSPAFTRNGQPGRSSRETHFGLADASYVLPAIAVLSSDVFWWWYTITSNLRDLNPSDIQGFPVPASALEDNDISELGLSYVRDLKKHSTMLVREQKQTGTTRTQSFKIQKSKPIIDKINNALAKHYDFSAEELDFITSYDIKYRMGVTDDSASS